MRIRKIEETGAGVIHIRLRSIALGQGAELKTFLNEFQNCGRVPYLVGDEVFLGKWRNYDERHSVRPGLTGWAQTQYSYGSTVEDAFHKLEYDLFYLKNMSIIFDLAIVFQTIHIVVGGRGSR